MSLAIGQKIGSYEITSLLGKGGMGEVYRARDLKLKREVAIKVLPDEFSRNVDRLSRFQRGRRRRRDDRVTNHHRPELAGGVAGAFHVRPQ